MRVKQRLLVTVWGAWLGTDVCLCDGGNQTLVQVLVQKWHQVALKKLKKLGRSRKGDHIIQCTEVGLRKGAARGEGRRRKVLSQ